MKGGNDPRDAYILCWPIRGQAGRVEITHHKQEPRGEREVADTAPRRRIKAHMCCQAGEPLGLNRLIEDHHGRFACVRPNSWQLTHNHMHPGICSFTARPTSLTTTTNVVMLPSSPPAPPHRPSDVKTTAMERGRTRRWVCVQLSRSGQMTSHKRKSFGKLCAAKSCHTTQVPPMLPPLHTTAVLPPGNALQRYCILGKREGEKWSVGRGL